MFLLRVNDSFIGAFGITKNLSHTVAVKFENSRLFFPTNQKYLVYPLLRDPERPNERVVSFDDTGGTCRWLLNSDNVLMTTNYEILQYAEGFTLKPWSHRYINNVTGVALHSPRTSAEKLVTDGVITIPLGIDINLLNDMADIVHASPHERISNLLHENATFSKIFSANLRNFLNEFFAQDYHLTTYSSNNLLKGVDKRFWHVDYPYHNIASPYLAEVTKLGQGLWLSVQVIVPLDDFTAENGATVYVPESHHYLSWPVAGHRNEILTIPRGHAAIFIGSLWHSQGLNTTDNPRAALLANFSPTSVPAKDPIAKEVEEVPAEELYLDQGKVFLR